jgi:hypothetical protein
MKKKIVLGVPPWRKRLGNTGLDTETYRKYTYISSKM